MFLILIFLVLLLSGCTKSPPVIEAQLVSANRIIEKTVTLPPPELSMAYRLENNHNPALLHAYQEYLKTGITKTIETDQFVQFPYNSGSQPIIAANVLELTVVSLEPGEQVTSVSCGDPSRWSFSLAYSGSNKTRQAHVMLKPAKANISTDFFITTDRRAYILKLVSNSNGKYVREVRFWYPQLVQNDLDHSHRDSVITQFSKVEINHLNFNYQITPNHPIPSWTPIRVFDDGTHTYIQFPNRINSSDLPVLFVKNANTQEIVNYRFKNPYFVVDKIFRNAELISGIGRQQQRVMIWNKL